MAYLSIPNLYKNQTILRLAQDGHTHCYALEKIHGTSAHIGWKNNKIRFFSGGCKQAEFEALFNEEALAGMFALNFDGQDVVIYGEAFGGKMQGMSRLYGKELRFLAFDVLLNGQWMNVPVAADIVRDMGLGFVPFALVPLTLEALNAERDRPCRCGVAEEPGEGIVIRPVSEMMDGQKRLIAKHKRAEFSETKTHREVDPAKITACADADKVAEEWVTTMRLTHVLDKAIPGGEKHEMKHTPIVIKAMMEDVKREAGDEVVWSPEVYRAIGTKTAKMFKAIVMKVPA